MRKGASYNLGQYRLFLLLLTVSLFVGTKSMHALPDFSAGNLPTELTEPYVRSYKLYSRCSSKFLTIRFGRRDVNARGRPSNKYAKLLLESESHDGLIKIKSEATKRYLCFNKVGKLIVRHYGESIQCKFREVITEENYTKFQSAANSRWYIGFRANGKPARGFKGHRRREKCYQFLKREDTKKFQVGPKGVGPEGFEQIYFKHKGNKKRRKSGKSRRRSKKA